MFKRTATEKGEYSPRRCEDFLKLNTFDGQRPVSQDHIQNLIKAMADNTFRRGEIAVARKMWNGLAEVLVNGQHQLHAAIVSGKAMYATVDRYDCPKPEDLWHLFGTFDVHRGRTEQHIMKAARGLFKSGRLQEVPLQILHSCGTALTYCGGGTMPNFGAKVGAKFRKAELVQQYENDVLTINSFSTNDTKYLLKIPVVTAMIVTHRTNADAAQKFWEPVLTGVGLAAKTPQHVLHNKLSHMNSIDVARISNTMARQAAIYSLCIAWWNAWRTGKDRSAVKIGAMKSIPEVQK